MAADLPVSEQTSHTFTHFKVRREVGKKCLGVVIALAKQLRQVFVDQVAGFLVKNLALR